MITHDDIWRAIETIARERNLSVSALAKKAGLDATSFNKSKRFGVGGRERWPSTESLTKVLDVAEMTLRDLADIIEFGSQREGFVEVPIVKFGDLGGPDFDALGLPVMGSFTRTPLPCSGEVGAFIVIGDDDPPHPLRPFQKLIVAPSKSFRRGDVVLARQSNGNLILGTFVDHLKHTIEVKSLADEASFVVVNSDIVWLGRVLWLTA